MNDSADHSRFTDLFAQRERQCHIEQRAYQMWLDRIIPFKWFCVGGGTALSAIAGATVLARPEFLGLQGPIIGGVCALISSVLTGLHTALKCEANQAECQRLILLYSSLEALFQAARALPMSEITQKSKELEGKFEEARTKATAVPPGSCREKAEREVAKTQISIR